ncbi:cytochrome-c oxidase, cbb3-type subunit III [Aliiroseovarius sp. PTFE2010]|uniref:cytochrome-c oxidase, cbb3-type subunit III n=1 Tax=Aliiroseovarius sp. PTFE2010 TaxID=3417190 RepID=UPI003CE6C98B
MTRNDKESQVETTGHSWDGIEEYNNPLPRWWLWTFYATIIWGIGYTIAYPAWPGIKGATQGLLGYSTREEVAKDIQTFSDANAKIETQLASADLTTVTPGTPLYDFARNAGAAVFRTNCSQCHGSGAAGAVGYPNLLDDDWLWGGALEDIRYTIAHGIRNEDDFDAHYSEMPRFGADELLEPQQIEEVVQHVLALSGQDHDASLASAGAVVFEENCAVCHMEDGAGDPSQGAPNLTDAIWLYGGSQEAITDSVVNARFGVMPAWGLRLDDADVNAVALYVHQLGGGE